MTNAHKVRELRLRRHRRVRKKVRGTAERPRLAVFRSNNHITAQVIDDIAGRTLAAASTTEADLRSGPRATATPPRRSARWSPNERRPPVFRRWSSIGADSCTTAASRPSQMQHEKTDWNSDGRTRSRSRPGAEQPPQLGRRQPARVAGDQHQPRRQGRQGRPALQLHRARRHRRRQRSRRLGLRQGQGSAARHPEGHRRSAQEPLQRRAGRLDDHPSGDRPRGRRSRADEAGRSRYRRHRRWRGAPSSKRPASTTCSASRWARPTTSTSPAPPSPASRRSSGPTKLPVCAACRRKSSCRRVLLNAYRESQRGPVEYTEVK